jgi:hypothetical protein
MREAGRLGGWEARKLKAKSNEPNAPSPLQGFQQSHPYLRL